MEPVSVAELKKHLRLTESADTIDESTISIPFVSHGIGTVTGSAADVLYKKAVVALTPGAIGATSVIILKIQESDSSTTGFTDWYTFAAQGAVSGKAENFERVTKFYDRYMADDGQGEWNGK